MNSKSILVIDDNPDIGTALNVLCMLANIKCTSVLTPAEGLTKLSQQSFDLVIQDMNFTNDMTSGDEGITLFIRSEKFPVICRLLSLRHGRT